MSYQIVTIRCLFKLFAVSAAMLAQNSAAAATAVPNEFTSGSPALATEVNDNFTGLASAIDNHWSRYPDRYYPDWRYDPSYYLTLPTLGGNWKGRIRSEYHYSATSRRTFNFINSYNSTTIAKWSWLGVTIVPSPDASAHQESMRAAGFAIEDRKINLYKILASHHLDGVSGSTSFTNDASLDEEFNGYDWNNFVPSYVIDGALASLYSFLKLTDTAVMKNCGSLNLHLKADGSVDVTGSSCVEVPY